MNTKNPEYNELNNSLLLQLEIKSFYEKYL
jgi:hypothetical protein